MKLFIVLSIALVATLAESKKTKPDKRCIFPCTMIYKPVCGNDGKTYPSECAMRGAACLKKKAIVAVYNGECRQDDGGCNFACTMIYKPVCGHDGNVYPSECVMRGASCRSKKPIVAVKDGPKCGDCNIACTREYNPVCGSDGKTYPTACVMRSFACKQKKAIITVYAGKCRM